MNRDAERERVTQKRIPKLLKQADNFELDLRRPRRSSFAGDSRVRDFFDQVSESHSNLSLRLYILFSPLLFKVPGTLAEKRIEQTSSNQNIQTAK
jgi:hypothetical protein